MTLLPRPRATLLSAACLMLGLASPAMAQGTAEQREACTPDALKLCSDTIPDVARTTACMKRHEAELTPRCRAVVETPGESEPPAARRREVRRARREASPDEAPSSQVNRREPRMADAPDGYDAPQWPSRGGDHYEDEHGVRDAPAGEGAGPGIRYFAPGGEPYEADGPDGDAPHGYDQGSSYARLPNRDGPGFADRGGMDDWGRPGPGRFAPPGFARDDYGVGPEDQPRPRSGRRRARAVIARLCAAGEIDPRTCAVTRRALQRQSRE